MTDLWPQLVAHLKIAGAVALVIGLPAEMWFLKRYERAKRRAE